MVLFGLKDQDVEELQITQVVDDILERGMSLSSRKQNTMMDVDSLTLALLQTTAVWQRRYCIAMMWMKRWCCCRWSMAV